MYHSYVLYCTILSFSSQQISQPFKPITKGLFSAVLFTQQIMSGYQEEITRHNKKQKTQLEDTEPQPDTAEILEL